jgi:predicted alpha/beta-fold hydrolase
VVRLNQRNCGDTEHLSRGLYHSGLTHDPLFVIRELIVRDGISAIAVAGVFAWRQPDVEACGRARSRRRLPSSKAVCAVSPTMDLEVCVRALERRSNLAYEWNFVRNLKARMRRKATAFPDDYTLDALRRVWTVRSSTKRIRRRITVSATPATTTTVRARCA